MKRMVLAALAVLALTALPASAGPPQALGSWAGSSHHSEWIEQEDDWPEPTDGTAITNPFGDACMWSVNDREALISFGDLAAGATVSYSRCVVHDYDPVAALRNGTYSDNWHMAIHGMSTAWIMAKVTGLVVTVCFSPQGRCFSPAQVKVDRQYEWSFCGHAHYAREDPAVVEIPGSNGGHGVISTVTTSISNPTERRIRDVTARVGYASDVALFLGRIEALGCLPETPYTDHSEYPLRWTMS